MSLVLLNIPALVLLYLLTIYLSTSQLSRKGVDGEQGSGFARLKIFFTLLKNDVTLTSIRSRLCVSIHLSTPLCVIKCVSD